MTIAKRTFAGLAAVSLLVAGTMAVAPAKAQPVAGGISTLAIAGITSALVLTVTLVTMGKGDSKPGSEHPQSP